MTSLENLGETLRWCTDRLAEAGAHTVKAPPIYASNHSGKIFFDRKDVLRQIICDEGNTDGEKTIGRFHVEYAPLPHKRPLYTGRVDVNRVIRILDMCHDVAENMGVVLAYHYEQGQYHYIYIGCYSSTQDQFEGISSEPILDSVIDHGNYIANTYVKRKSGVEYHCYLHEDKSGDMGGEHAQV